MKLLELFSQTWQSSLQGHRRRHYYNCFHMLRSISSSLILMCKIGWFSPLTHTHTHTSSCFQLVNLSMCEQFAQPQYVDCCCSLLILKQLYRRHWSCRANNGHRVPLSMTHVKQEAKIHVWFQFSQQKKKKKTWTRKGEIGSCCKLYAEQNFNQMSKPSGSTSNWTEGIWVC